MLNSSYNNKFINIFGDSEARLFFSKSILFVEGKSELELFSNEKLKEQFYCLRNIDVYVSDNIVGESINPSNSKLDIPYLFLFDLDKILKINHSTSGNSHQITVGFKNNGDLFQFENDYFNKKINYYKKGYSKNYREIKDDIEELIFLSKKSYQIDRDNINIIEKYLFNRLMNLTNKCLERNNLRFIRTTFEGLIINLTSYKLFLDWVCYKYKISERNQELYQWIESLNNRYDEETISTSLRIYIDGGKTEFLDQKKDIERRFPNNNVSKLLEEMRNMRFISANDFKKANGWVTEFIDFSIDEIKKNCNGKNFSSYFSRHFPELYDIILRLQFDSLESP